MYRKILVLVIFTVTLNGCAMFGDYHEKHTRSTSLVQFLYPNGNPPLNDKSDPVLNLPLKVGLAFIPGASDTQITSVTKNQLLENVKKAFESRIYINEIIIIPEIYLQQRRGFSTLEQIKSLYQLDVIALVSYDQIVNGRDNIFSLSYLTIVGAYIFPGSGYDVSTLIDLAVIDIDSQSILFRSAGTSGGKGVVAEAYKQQAYRKKQNEGFAIAMQQMQENLQGELDKFEQRLRNKSPEERIQVRHRKGYSGGAVSLNMLILLLLISGWKYHAGKTHRF